MDRIVGYWVNPTKTDIMNKNISDYTNAGITDLYIGTNREGHTIWGEKATIEEVISKFKHSGIRIHVWMPTFKDADNNWISPKNWSTTKINSVGTLIDIVKDLNKIDGLAGIHFDSIRYPGTAKGDTDSITNFCKAANEAVSDDMVLSAAIMGEPSANAYYYGQDAAAMINAGLNYLTGMIYRCTYGGDQSWMKTVMTAFQKVDPDKIIAGVCCYNSDSDATSYDEATLLSDIQAMLECGSQGVVIFVEHLSNFKGLGDDKVEFTPAIIAEAGLRVYNWIKKNGSMPNYVTINELQIPMPQFLYLAAFAARKVGSGSTAAFELIDVAEPTISDYTFTEGYMETEEIMSQAYAIKTYCQTNSKAPTYRNTTLGKVPYKVLVFTFARITAFIQTYNRLPSKTMVEDVYTDEEEEDDGTSLVTIDYVADRQDNAYQCGPSSMKMALSHYGLTVGESWLATKMGTNSTSGTTVAAMVAVISTVNSTYGTSLKANSETFSSWETLRGYLKSGYPVILRVQSWLNPNGGEHYVLMYGLDITNSKAYLGDPSYGKRTVTLTDLRERIRKVSSNSVIVIKK